MNVSHKYKCIFFHVPKTGGSSIEDLPIWDAWSGHFPRAAELKRNLDEAQWANYFKFAFVRNPWDRFVSLYHYLATMTPAHRWHQADEQIAQAVRQFADFRVFCLALPNWEHRRHFHFWPQHRWLCDDNGEILVDFVGRFESFAADFVKVCDRLEVPRAKLPHVNRSSHPDYRQCYDQETTEIIGEFYREDCEKWGIMMKYEFIIHHSSLP